MSLFASHNVEKLKRKRNVRGLARAAPDREPSVRKEAVAALGELDDVQAAEPLVEAALFDSNPEIRAMASGAISSAPAVRRPAVDRLRTRAVDGDLDTCERAAETLRMLGDTDVSGEFIAILRDPGQPGRRQAAAALGRLKDERAVEPLVEALQDADDELRVQAAQALGYHLLDARAIEPLATAALDDPSYDVRSWALSGLEQYDECPVQTFVPALKSDDPERRARAADALGHLPDPRSVEPLMVALDDDEDRVRDTATRSLGKVGDPRAFEPLVALLRHRDVGAVRAATEALGELRDVRAIEPLITALGHDEFMVRSAVAEALGEVGDARAIEPLLPLLHDAFTGEAAAAALMKLAMRPDAEALRSVVAQHLAETARSRERMSQAMSAGRNSVF